MIARRSFHSSFCSSRIEEIKLRIENKENNISRTRCEFSSSSESSFSLFIGHASYHQLNLLRNNKTRKRRRKKNKRKRKMRSEKENKFLLSLEQVTRERSSPNAICSFGSFILSDLFLNSPNHTVRSSLI